MSIILFEKDPFVDAIGAKSDDIGFKNINVRRPLSGIKIKENRFAFLSIRQASTDGNLVPISMRDSSAPGGYSQATHNFILQDVQEQRQENLQIVQTFGDNFAFFYGQKPIVIQCSGMLINTVDFNWKNEWLYNYENFLRGTRCVENRARVYLGFDDTLVEGYMLTTNFAFSKDSPYLCPFGFQILVTNQVDLSSYNSPVTRAEEAASLGSLGEGSGVDIFNASGETTSRGAAVVEYIEGPHHELRYDVDPLTGDATNVSDWAMGKIGPDGSFVSASQDPTWVPASISDNGTNTHTAFWTSAKDPPFKQWKDPDNALVSLDVSLAAEQSNVDVVTARLAMKSNSSQFPMASRSDDSSSIGKSLSLGVSNSAAVLADAPVLD